MSPYNCFANAWEPGALATLLRLHAEHVPLRTIPAQLIALGYKARTRNACKCALRRAKHRARRAGPSAPILDREMQRLALNRPWR